jgi:tRNA 2-thiouridine synthesizing protein A
MTETKADITLDTKGSLCPMPVVKTKLAIEEMASGQVIKVLATDPGSKADFPAWCSETGNKLLLATEDDGIHIFFIEKA